MIRLLSLFTTVAGIALAMPALAAAPGLDAFGWKKRVLVIVARPDDPAFLEQKRILDGERAGLGERDMVVLAVTGSMVDAIFGNADGIRAQAIRKDAGLGSGDAFAVVLVGKDGGVKLRRTTPVGTDDLFGLIDAMPMRAGEMRR